MKKIHHFIHYLFVPKETNNYRAKLLHHDFLTGYLVLAILLSVFFKFGSTSSGSVMGYATDISATKLLEMTNQERTKAGLSPLRYNDLLSAAAHAKANDMFTKNYWSHYGPNNENPWQFILGSGYDYEFAGENLAKNFLFSNGVVNAWMASPTHRENIMRKEYTDVGFAVINGVLNGEETTLVVQMFGAPMGADSIAQQPAAPPSNQQNNDIVVNQSKDTLQNPAVINIPAQTSNFSWFNSYYNLNILFFVILLIALMLDFYFATKLKIIRIHGKHLIHAMFIGALTVGLLIIVKGKIL